MSEQRKRLRQRLEQPQILLLPGAYDPFCARMIQQAGFEAVYMTGSGVAIGRVGFPDIGLVSLTEMAEAATILCDAVELPVIADADTGYGNALNVRRTIKAYERAGVAALQLEDQVFPKRCGHLAGKQVIPADEFVAKLKSALDARTDPDMLIIARTDARATHGLQEALDRAQMFEEAGADIIFIEAPTTIEELRQVPAAVHLPCLANMVEGGRTPLLSAPELEALGFRIALYANAVTRFLAKQVPLFLQRFQQHGGSPALVDEILPFDDLQRIVGTPGWMELEQRYQVAGAR